MKYGMFFWAPRYSGRSRAFTLVEVLIASSLFFVIFGLATRAFVFHSRYVKRVAARSSLQNRAIFLSNTLSRELSETNVEAVFLDPGRGLVFPQPRDLNGTLSFGNDGEILWSRFSCYQTVDVDGLSRLALHREGATIPSPDPLSPLGETPPRDLDYFLASSLPRKLFPGEVSELSVTRVLAAPPPGSLIFGAPPTVSSSAERVLELKIVVAETVAGGSRLELESTTNVAPRYNN